MDNNDLYLYLVVVGGRIPKANIEVHDVRWVIGSKIEDTFDDLRKDWFGSIDELHIDSYKKIYSVDGYKIKLKKSQNKKSKYNIINKTRDTKKLWFINLGGYNPKSMQEKHEFGLVVASSSSEAKNIAKQKWLDGCKKKHKDDIASLGIIKYFDDYQIIENVENWEIMLEPDENFIESETLLVPDWYGYMRIDNI